MAVQLEKPEWYYAQGGQQHGPMTLAQMTEAARAGRFGRSDLVWREGMADWQPASTVPGLFDAPASAAQPQMQPQQPYQQAPSAGMPGAYPSAGGYAPPTQQVGYASPYQPPAGQYMAGQVPNYLVPAILVTIFCCWPFGIPAIVFAAQVNSKLASGDYHGAVDASGKAKMWTWISFGLGMGVIVLYILLIIVSIAAEA